MILAVWIVTAISSTCEIRFTYYKRFWLFELDPDNISQVTALLDLFLISVFLKLLTFYLYVY